MYKKLAGIITLILTLLLNSTVISAEKQTLSAAFIRNQQLWLKIDDIEQVLTKDEQIRSPKWSFDGEWIAYLKSIPHSNDYPMYEGQLWAYHIKSHKHIKITEKSNSNFQWSPAENTIAYQNNNVLSIISVTRLIPQLIHKNAINYSWLLDGSGLLTSSKKNENKVFSDIVLNKILFDYYGNMQKKLFYTIHVGKDEYLYGTSQFKWSFDEQWIAFQLTPTASLSADSNILCVIDNEGKSLRKIGEMLNYQEWFQWAPHSLYLAFIQGSNRIATINKRLAIHHVYANETHHYTQEDMAIRDLFWLNNTQLFISQSFSSKWVSVPKRPLPSIFLTNIYRDELLTVTSPPLHKGDFFPYFEDRSGLIWIRTNRLKGDVYRMEKDPIEQKWIEGLDVDGIDYYEHWNWNEVFSLYVS
ncbi:hypothetical protein [Cytobacillus purgationiresistens]|uniref:TolB domain-containing protein n=1 Tax=Cytobacillus purgationiresistens TaxID=863449 RepID=A0ABU0AAB4_9BACI|nr:hypothetical protein [Cytobacillus purgationiresistens]MDQ0268183.1 hypothetical protein [Cytobacillus purgationiresistens]